MKRFVTVVLLLVALSFSVGCGRKAPPQPPLEEETQALRR